MTVSRAKGPEPLIPVVPARKREERVLSSSLTMTTATDPGIMILLRGHTSFDCGADGGKDEL